MNRWAWVVACSVGTAFVILAAAAGQDVRQDIRGLAAVSFVVVATIRVRRDDGLNNRPWVLAITGAALGFLGTLLAAFRYDYAIPSPADPIIYASYVLILFALREFNRARNDRKDVDEILDATLVACAAAVVIFAGILSVYLTNVNVPVIERLTNGIYAGMTVSMIGAIARLAVAPGTRNTAWRLLAAAIMAIVVSDLLIVLSTAGVSWGYSIWTVIGCSPFVFGTAGVLHPAARHLTDPAPPMQTKLTRARLAMVGFALLIVPVVLIVARALGHAPNYPMVIAGSATLSLLSLARLSRLFRAQEATSKVDAWLNDASAALLASHTEGEIVGATISSIRHLVARSAPGNIIEFWRSWTDGYDVQIENGCPELADRSLAESLAALVQTTQQLTGSASLLQPGRVPVGDNDSVCVTRIDKNDGTIAGLIVIRSSSPISDQTRRGTRALASQVALALQSAELSMRLARARVERRFRSLIEKSSDVVLILDTDGVISFVSPAITHILGRDEASLLGQKLTEIVEPDDWRGVERALSWVLRGGRSALPIEARLLSDAGETRWFELVWRDLRDDEEIQGLVVNAREITDRKLADERMARSEARFRALVQHSTDMVIVVDATGFVQYVSPSVPQVLGLRSDVVLGSSIAELLGAGFAAQSARFEQPFDRMDLEVRTLSSSGKQLELMLTVSDLRLEPAVGGIVINARDVTAHRSLQEDLRRRTNEDELTGLPNRGALVARINERLREGRAIRCGVLTIDLDDFKTINDGLGTAVGDEVLNAIAGRIRDNLRLGDGAARLAGDEFAVLLGEVTNEVEAMLIAERLIDVIGRPLAVNDEQIVVNASIGATLNELGATADDLLRDADTALHVAKKDGKKRVTMFEARMRADASDRFELKSGLRRGILYGELVDLYQPKVSLLNDRISGSEVLVRWQHPERGLLGPNSFIPLAEETGLIVPLGQWVLEHAVANLLRWNDRLPSDRQLDVSVNVSARQLEQPEAVDHMIDAVRRSGVDPSLIVLELTESLFVSEVGTQREQIERLFNTGFRLSVDDFGTGYSSLRYLELLPINEIKIDRSFIEGVDRSANKQAVLTRIVELAADLGYHTVAEGIEGGAELVIVRRVGCDYGQGFYFSRPISIDRFEDLIGLTTLV